MRALIRIAVLAVILALGGVALSQRPSVAAPAPAPSAPPSILPQSVGVGVTSHAPVTLAFVQPMDVSSVAEQLQVSPQASLHLTWSDDARQLRIAPSSRCLTDERYVVLVPANTRLANGSVLGAPLTYSFTTQTAPYVNRFEVERVGPDPRAVRLSVSESLRDAPAVLPADTAENASARTAIRIGFSAAMNRAEIERAFLVSPEVPGGFSWEGTTLVFTPAQRLDPDARYAISFFGAHDLQGNPLGGDTSFSFTTGAAVRLVKMIPANGASGVTAGSVVLSFSGPVDTDATQAAFGLVDAANGAKVPGAVSWNDVGSQLTFKASAALAAGHRFEIRLGDGATDIDGNSLKATLSFTTKAAPPPPAPRPAASSYPAPVASGSAGSYALSLINASRRAYGFAPLRLDAALSAVAQAHASDQIRYGYFSHVGRDGSTYRDRIMRAGISFSHAGENQCYDYGSLTHAIAWCHSIMMDEPYPGVWNHIANILDPNFNRVGFGYGRASSGRLIMTWDFAG